MSLYSFSTKNFASYVPLERFPKERPVAEQRVHTEEVIRSKRHRCSDFVPADANGARDGYWRCCITRVSTTRIIRYITVEITARMVTETITRFIAKIWLP